MDFGKYSDHQIHKKTKHSLPITYYKCREPSYQAQRQHSNFVKHFAQGGFGWAVVLERGVSVVNNLFVGDIIPFEGSQDPIYFHRQVFDEIIVDF